MSKHKAPTQVTIARTEDYLHPTEDTFLHRVVERYWKHGVVVAVAVTGFILFRVYQGQQEKVSAGASWDRLREEVDLGSGVFAQIQAPSPQVLAGLAEELKDRGAGPWAKALEVKKDWDEGEVEPAKAALAALESTWPEHALVQESWIFAEGEEPQTLPNHLRQRMDAIEQWEKGHPGLFANPPLPEGAPRVRLTTSAGPLVVGLDPGRAPKHVENFLKLCQEGFYDGTKFHRVIPSFMVRGGDPNSREGDPETWGQGDGGLPTIPPEISALRHFPHVLAAAKKPGEKESSGCQFYITTGAPHHLDGQHTVFGCLLEGEDVLETIESGTVVGDRPQDPVTIESVEVLD